MTIDDAVNKTVMLIIFSSDGLESVGIKEKKFYAKIVGRDSIGLWIENPKLETTRVRDDNGAIIPPGRRHLEEHVAYVLLPWGNIRSVVHFPTRQGFDAAEDEEASALGRGMYL
jgi:hypothetical protein